MNPQTINKIQQLLDRYYNGESTPEEEAELLALLDGNGSLPAHMQADASLFLQMNGISTQAALQSEAEAMSRLPEGFDERLQATIDRLSQASIQPRRRFTWMQRAAACASIVVILGAAIGFMAIPDDPFVDTCATPEQAEYQLNRALTLVSTFSRAGLEEARIGTQEQPREALPASRFISFD